MVHVFKYISSKIKAFSVILQKILCHWYSCPEIMRYGDLLVSINRDHFCLWIIFQNQLRVSTITKRAININTSFLFFQNGFHCFIWQNTHMYSFRQMFQVLLYLMTFRNFFHSFSFPCNNAKLASKVLFSKVWFLNFQRKRNCVGMFLLVFRSFICRLELGSLNLACTFWSILEN